MNPIKAPYGRLPQLVAGRLERKGILFVISGPSGCGKTTLCKKLLKEKIGLVNSVSITTRSPRRGEKKKVDYIYVTKPKFRQDIKRGRFLEYANVFDNYYGTPKKFVLEALAKGRDVLLNIDVQGAARVKKALKKSVLIFILPPTFKELKRRLLKRSSDSAKEISKRLNIARHEMSTVGLYDCVVINDKMDRATQQLIAVITSARCRIKQK